MRNEETTTLKRMQSGKILVHSLINVCGKMCLA